MAKQRNSSERGAIVGSAAKMLDGYSPGPREHYSPILWLELNITQYASTGEEIYVYTNRTERCILDLVSTAVVCPLNKPSCANLIGQSRTQPSHLTPPQQRDVMMSQVLCGFRPECPSRTPELTGSA